MRLKVMEMFCKQKLILISLLGFVLLALAGCTENVRGSEKSSICLAKDFSDKWGWCINSGSEQMVGSRCNCSCNSTSAKNLGQSVPGEVIPSRKADDYLPIHVCKY
jgi:hypothetical protein